MSSATKARRAGGIQLLLFVGVIFSSAFLILLVQPMVGKRILPWFGGSPSVWTLCLAFYQTTLFLGYAYAHLLIRAATASQKLIVHGLVLAAAVFVLPVLPSDAWKPAAAATTGGRNVLVRSSANLRFPFTLERQPEALDSSRKTRDLQRWRLVRTFAVHDLSNGGGEHSLQDGLH